MNKTNVTQQESVNPASDSACCPSVNELKFKFMTDMELAGLASTSRRTYLTVIERLIKHFWCSPAELTEQQVFNWILEYHRQNPPVGTFNLTHYALKFFFQHTLGYNWPLFKKNENVTSASAAQCS
jgi:hypothetical protein